MKKGYTELIDVKLGLTGIQRIMFGLNTIWENWKYQTGSLVKMTSNTTPKPFTATKTGWEGASAWCSFDWNLNNPLSTNNPNETGDITVTLMFGQEIRLAEITAWIGYGGPVFDNYDEPDPESGVSGGWGAGNKNWLKFYGIKADGTQVLLATHINYGSWADVNGSKRVHTVSEANQEIPFIGLTCHRGGRGGQGWYRLYDIQITKWFEKGTSGNIDLGVVYLVDESGNQLVDENNNKLTR